MADNPVQPKKEEGSMALVRDVGKRLNDIMGLLRTQQDLLQKRGINLPTSAMDNLRTLKKRSDVLMKNIGDSQQELRALRALAETTALINSPQKSEDVLNAVIDTVVALTGAERGYVVLKNKQTGELEFKVARGMDQSALDNGQGMIISKSMVHKVADTGEPILTDNASQDERLIDGGGASIAGLQLRSVMIVPLKVREEVIGVVYCDNRFMSGLFKQTDLDVLFAFANQAAVAIENVRLFESARMRLQEVTEIRDRMDNLFTSITSAVLTLRGERIIISNAAATTIFGTDQVVSHDLPDLVPDLADELRRVIKTVIDTQTQLEEEFQPVIKGKKRTWIVIASPMRGFDTNEAVAMVIDDISEQKQSESQLMEARRYLPAVLLENNPKIDINQITIQEREITALFADVRGFTTFSENLEPEELMTVINKYLSLASDAINLFDGIVDKYMGDAVTGLWNTQLNPQGDHSNRAIQAAMQLVYDLHALHEVLPESERLFYGIGVHTGEAVLGNTGGKGRKEFSALGEATDICKFLQEQAGPGEVIISEATYRLVSDYWEVEAAPIRRVKAGYEDIQCFRVIKRKKGAVTALIDDELLALLADDDDD